MDTGMGAHSNHGFRVRQTEARLQCTHRIDYSNLLVRRHRGENHVERGIRSGGSLNKWLLESQRQFFQFWIFSGYPIYETATFLQSSVDVLMLR